MTLRVTPGVGLWTRRHIGLTPTVLIHALSGLSFLTGGPASRAAAHPLILRKYAGSLAAGRGLSFAAGAC